MKVWRYWGLSTIIGLGLSPGLWAIVYYNISTQ